MLLLLVSVPVPVLVVKDDVVEEKDVSVVSLVLLPCRRNRFFRCRRSDRSSLRTRLRSIWLLDRSDSLASSWSLRTTIVIRASMSDVMGAVDVSRGGDDNGAEEEAGAPRRLFLLSPPRREGGGGTYDGHDGGGTSLGRTGFDTAVS